MKQLIFGISCILLALSLVWAYKTEWDWEPLIVLGGSIIGVITTMEFGISAKKLIGTWESVQESPIMHLEDLTLYGENERFASILKLHPIIYMVLKAKLHLSVSGFYNIKENKIYYTIENIDVIHHYGLRPEDIQSILIRVHQQKPVEILSFDKNKMITKNEDGSTTTSIKKSNKVDVMYFEKYAQEK